jgi:predicted nucleotidyltransferase
MLDLIEKNLYEIRQLCSQFNVSRLELFGSSLTGNFDPDSSDIDFLVEFKPLKQGQFADSYFGLLEAIKRLLGRKVDMVMIKAVKNPYFLQQINQKRQLLYAT